ncbi:MAG: hypothetical protein F6K55_11785 [Moorea sp. SIO4A3]|nr:hypothetical protein [Moorena sp. SIO4A3]
MGINSDYPTPDCLILQTSLPPIAYCLLPIAYCLLPIAYCLFPIPCNNPIKIPIQSRGEQTMEPA